jgi:hypothetical protein
MSNNIGGKIRDVVWVCRFSIACSREGIQDDDPNRVSLSGGDCMKGYPQSEINLLVDSR